MKKYIKPDISFFELSLSTSISAGCALDKTSVEFVCPVQVPGQPGLTVFQRTSGCTAYSPGMQDSVCYHVPVADINVFES